MLMYARDRDGIQGRGGERVKVRQSDRLCIYFPITIGISLHFDAENRTRYLSKN